jgi:pectate lyase
MRKTRMLLRAACLAAAWIATSSQAQSGRDLGRETLHPDNGWAASGAGVTGGSAAAPEQIYTVTNRRELIAALNNGVPSSTSPSAPSIVGLGENAVIKGAWFDLRGSAASKRTNIIIRNLTFRDAYDCFPEWSPTDGAAGAWNALYDSISLRDTNNVWVDHNTFEDRDTADATLPQYFGVIFQVHDGLLDITNASDLVTVSWNRFRNHDKTMLIGSSDSGATAANDRGKLRVTLHHNVFDGIGQRAPRVRFGQVHVYNN